MSALQEMIDALGKMSPAAKAELSKEVIAHTPGLKWFPNKGPQSDAYHSKADVLLYGGEPGGGKSALLLGLAFTEHRRSLIMRRQYTTLTPLIDEALAIHGSRDGFNGSPPPKLRIDSERLIEFGAAARAGDEQDWQGNPHDFLGFDEGTQFLEQQIRFLMGWLRSTTPGQRKRVVIATNPPMSSDGAWVVQMFAPWLDERHPRPAKPGELRWFVTDTEGKDLEVGGPESIESYADRDVRVNGKAVAPVSRTFIPASVADNPYLANTDYQKNLDAMVEPFRSILLGRFKNAVKDNPFQVIPTSWVREAQSRWTPQPPRGVPMCAIGVDVAQGGSDNSVLAPRYDGWYAQLIAVPGVQTPLGSDTAGLVIARRRNNADIVLDMGGGYGGGCYQTLMENGIKVIAYKGAAASTRRTKDRKLGFTNKRSETYWAFREALDPDQQGGSPICLPPDQELLGDLTAPTYEANARGIQVLAKDKVCELLGRSPDKGDAVVMAWVSQARSISTERASSAEQAVSRASGPKVDMGPRHRNSIRR